MALEKLATTLRALQLYAHHAHNNCTGKSFFQDHEFFGELYSAAELDYDSVIERMIGTTGNPVDTLSIASQATKLALQCGRDPGDCNVNFLQGSLRLELAICVYVDKVCATGPEMPEGTRQLIGDIANKSMARQYKIRQRLK